MKSHVVQSARSLPANLSDVSHRIILSKYFNGRFQLASCLNKFRSDPSSQPTFTCRTSASCNSSKNPFSNRTFATYKPESSRLGHDASASFSQYLNKRVSFEGCIVKELFSSYNCYKALTVEVEAEAWRNTVGPAIQAATPSWQATPSEKNRFKKTSALRGRNVTVCGNELAWVKKGQRCVFTGSWTLHHR
jgi:hypothetical protein